jgi:uncharacterized protein
VNDSKERAKTWMQAIDGSVAIEIAGERITLLPSGAAYWERARTLLVADAHIGKAATFRANAIPVPRGTTTGTLDRLSDAIVATAAARVVFLGDLLHARDGRDPHTLERLSAWRHRWDDVDVLLVRGNHDRGAGDPPPEAGITCLAAPVRESPFVLAHHPKLDDEGYVFAGHLHPAAVMRGAGRQRECLPCFWVRPRVMVLPAFGDFTGVSEITAEEQDHVYLIAGDLVIDVSASAG